MASKKRKRSELLERFSYQATKATGTSMAFLLAVATIVVWGITGPLFHFSDTWQLVINTGTTIVTFLMVFLIQRSSNAVCGCLQSDEQDSGWIVSRDQSDG